MTLNKAIDIAWGIDKLRGEPRPTPQEAMERIDQQLATCGFNWLTGQEACRVLREACKQPNTTRQEKPMAKTTLTLDVEYDEQVTDPESIASAADRLLETALSTPEIMEEYGTPQFGKFFVAAADTSVPTPKPSNVAIPPAAGDIYRRTICIPVFITFSTDPAELDDRESENSPTKESLMAYLKDAMRLDVDTEDEGQPEGAVFAAAGVDWNAADVVDDASKNQPPDHVGVELDKRVDVRRRWVLYDLDADVLLGTRVYTDHDEAVEDAARANDILVLPLMIQGITI